MVEVIWSPEALTNLQAIFEYIARDSEYYAKLLMQQIIHLVETIPDFPRAGRMVPEYMREDLRERIFQNYRIVYRIKTGTIEIVAISHSAKPLGDL